MGRASHSVSEAALAVAWVEVSVAVSAVASVAALVVGLAVVSVVASAAASALALEEVASAEVSGAASVVAWEVASVAALAAASALALVEVLEVAASEVQALAEALAWEADWVVLPLPAWQVGACHPWGPPVVHRCHQVVLVVLASCHPTSPARPVRGLQAGLGRRKPFVRCSAAPLAAH